MIAADTSSLVAYFSGATGPDVDQVAAAMAAGELVLPPVVLAEILTDPESHAIGEHLSELTLLEITDGHWQRAGLTRRILTRFGQRPKVAETLIAQCCIDNDVALITRNKGFRHFAPNCGLKLA